MRVCFVYVGAEGSAHDSTVLHWSKLLAMNPDDFYAIADAGYSMDPKVLTPFRGVRYHLKEWARCDNGRPQDPKELFNLRHAKARNIVERLIGVLKRRFRVLRTGCESKFDTSRTTMFACILLHNFIRHVDQDDFAQDLEELRDIIDRPPMDGMEDDRSVQRREDERTFAFDFQSATTWRSWIADAMWAEYQEFRATETVASPAEINENEYMRDADEDNIEQQELSHQSEELYVF